MVHVAPPEPPAESPAARVAPGAPVADMAREISQRELPIGELVPLRRPQFISREALLEGMRGVPRIDLADLRRDMDRYVDPYFEPREW